MTESTRREYLEMVDDHNQVIGIASRYNIHQKALRHRSVHIFIFNSQGDLYHQKRSPQKDQYPDHWDSSAAGHTDPGESPREAAQRELMEELGLDVPLTEVLEYPSYLETGWEFVTLFIAQTDNPIQLNPEEATTGDFLTQAQLTQYLSNPLQKMTPGFRLLVALWQGQTTKLPDSINIFPCNI